MGEVILSSLNQTSQSLLALPRDTFRNMRPIVREDGSIHSSFTLFTAQKLNAKILDVGKNANI